MSKLIYEVGDFISCDFLPNFSFLQFFHLVTIKTIEHLQTAGADPRPHCVPLSMMDTEAAHKEREEGVERISGTDSDLESGTSSRVDTVNGITGSAAAVPS
jgi:hypothetical protein